MVTYFCFIETGGGALRHMEPLAADTPITAAVEALAVLRSHNSGVVAHVFHDDVKLASVRREVGP